MYVYKCIVTVATSCTSTFQNVIPDIPFLFSDTPDPPCNIIIGDLKDDGSLEIRWDPPKQDGGHPIRHYCLQVTIPIIQRYYLT